MKPEGKLVVTNVFYGNLMSKVALRKDVELSKLNHILHVATTAPESKDGYAARCSAQAWLVRAARTPSHAKLAEWVEVHHE